MVEQEASNLAKDRKKIFRILFISVFSAMLGLGIVVPLLPFYAESLGATGVWIGAIFSGFAFSRAIFMPIIGKLSDKRGRRIFILSGLLIYTILSFTYIYADSVYTLTGIRVVHGMASAMVIPVSMAYIADLSPKGREGEYMGTFTVSLFLGMGFGPFLGGLIKDLFGMPATFISMAIFSAISLLICLVFLPESSNSLKSSPSFLKAVRNKLMAGVLFFRTMNAFATGGFMVFLPVIASMQNISSTQIGILISISIFTTALLQRRFGKLADRHTKSKIIVVGSFIVSIGLLLIPFQHSFWELLFSTFLIGLGSALSLPSAIAIVTIAGRDVGQGSAMSAFNTAMSIGMITAPMISGGIMDMLGVFYVFIFSGAITLVSIPIFIAIISTSGVKV
jgi:MFS family permease